jgi:hypothetical protein
MGDPLSTTNEQLYGVYSNLAELNGVHVNALTKQTGIMEMVRAENQRLADKKSTIDQAVENQKRIIYFNDNSRKLSSAWLTIIITITLALGALFLVRVIYFHGFLPDMLFNVLVVAIISITILVVLNYYKDIRARDNYNFDELRFKRPIMADANKTSETPSAITVPATCIGTQCCTAATESDPGTVWNAVLGKCVSVPSSTPGAVPELEEFKVMANEPLENQYAFIR